MGFFRIRTAFCSVSTFSRPGVIFMYVVCWNIEYIFGHICRISQLRGLVKAYIHLSNNTFLIDTVVISLSNYIWENTELPWPPRNNPSKFALVIGNCQGKSVFLLMCFGKLLPRRNCLNNIHGSFWINYCN